MRVSFYCVSCGKSQTTTADTVTAGQRKLKWTKKGIDYICPDCMKPKGTPRIRANHVHAAGFKFDSETEYRYYLRLKKRQERGEICDLEVHPAYVIFPAYKDKFERVWKVIRIKFDFGYTVVATGVQMADDVKGFTSNDRAIALLPVVQRLHPGTMFRFCDEWGRDWKPPKRSKKHSR